MKQQIYYDMAVADPNSQEPDFLKAINDDPELAALHTAQLEQDKALFGVFSDTPKCPNHLVETMLAFSDEKETRKKPWSPTSYLAIAASVVLAVVGLQYIPLSQGHNMDLSLHALSHSAHGHSFAGVTNTRPGLSKVNYQLASYGAQLSDASDVVWNKDCDFEGITSAHLVYRHQEQRFNVYLVPTTYDFDQVQQQFSDDEYEGTIKILDNNYLIIVGPKGHSVEPIVEKLDQDIIWQA